jgi:hypothetical protein
MRTFVIASLVIGAALLVSGCEEPQPQYQGDLVPGPSQAGDNGDLGPAGTAGACPVDDPTTVDEPIGIVQPLPPVPPVDPEPQPETADRTYVIRKGDTLWGIATRELGAGRRFKEIQALNPGLDPQKLQVGQSIVLPPR